MNNSHCDCGRVPTAGKWAGNSHTGYRRGVHCARCTIRTQPGAARYSRPPCVHLGQPTGEVEACGTCQVKRELPVFACDVFGTCTRTKTFAGRGSCEGCERFDAGPALDVVPGLVDPLAGAYVWPPTVEYRRGEDSKARHLAALRVVVESRPTLPTGGAERGIVWVGGGKYWPGIVAGVRLLREVGCALPVEVWHRGTCEPVNPADVSGLGVRIVDADALSEARGDNRVIRGNEEFGGWESKLYALTHTEFAQALFLDADAYLVADPAPLFDLLSPAEPFVFWSDLPGLERNVKWPRVWPTGGAGVPTVQGGQLLFDRRHAARLLAVCHWICQHSDYYFGWMFGDQDGWRVALAAGACGYRHLGAAPWLGVAFVCRWKRADYIVHRCQGKLFKPADIPPGKTEYGKPHYNLPMESRVFTHFAAALAGERDSAAVFREIYARKLWSGGSGAGSRLTEAAPYLAAVGDLAAARGWRSAVDAGCGDAVVGVALAPTFDQYTGADVCAHLIDAHRKAHPGLRWTVADLAGDLAELPAADVLLVKDVLHHWPNDMVRGLLARVRAAGKWRDVLITSDAHQQADGADCPLGGYRALSPDMEPLCGFPLSIAFRYGHKAALLLKVNGD